MIHSLLDKQHLFGKTRDLLGGDLLLARNRFLYDRIDGSIGSNQNIILTRPATCKQKLSGIITLETKRIGCKNNNSESIWAHTHSVNEPATRSDTLE